MIQISIGKKVGFSFTLIIFLLLITCGISIFSLERLTEVIHLNTNVSNATHNMVESMLEARRHEKNYLAGGGNTSIEGNQFHIDALLQSASQIETIVQSSEEKQVLLSLKEFAQTYQDQFSKVVDLVEKKGANDVGVIGEFGRQVHQLEEIIKNYEIEQALPLVIRAYDLKSIITNIQNNLMLLIVETNLGEDSEKLYDVEDSADEFEEAIDIFVALSPTDETQLQTLQAQFDTFYQTGTEMAEAFLEEDAEQGAVLLATFNDAAEALLQLAHTLVREKTEALERQRLLPALLQVRETEKDYLLQGTSEFVEKNRQLNEALIQIVSGGQWNEEERQNLLARIQSYQELFAQVVAIDQEIGIAIESFQNSIHQVDQIIKTISTRGFQSIYVNQEAIDQQLLRSNGIIVILVMGTSILAIILSLLISKTVRGSLHKINHVVTNVTQSSQQISSGAQTQSSAIQEISSSVNELIGSIQDVAQHANQVSNDAHESSKQAEAGGLAVQQSIEAMSRISESSQRMSEIIDVISDIAEQTNLLALNASIEAARAGEHGRGFSVVADEVRKLAERSATATNEITKLIKESESRVAKGLDLSNKAGSRLKGIVDYVNKTADKIEQISSATEEQAATSNLIKDGMQQISSTVSDNTNLTKDLVTSSQNMMEEIQQITHGKVQDPMLLLPAN